MLFSIIIPCYNDEKQLVDTIKDLQLSTNTQDYEIIIVDDCSSVPISYLLAGFDNTRLKRLPCWSGPAVARQTGADMANGDWLLFTDSHMRFQKGWDDEFIQQNEMYDLSKSICCSKYLSLRNPPTLGSYGGQVPFPKESILACFMGATFDFYRHDDTRNGYHLADVRLLPYDEKLLKNSVVQVPSVIGAFYLVSNVWFHFIGGLNGLIGYGSEEPFMCFKSYLMGGNALALTRLYAGHLEQPPIPLGTRTNPVVILYNRLLLLKMLMSEEEFMSFIAYLSKSRIFVEAINLLEGNRKEHNKLWSYINDRKTTDVADICKQLRIQTPTEAIELVRSDYQQARNH